MPFIYLYTLLRLLVNGSQKFSAKDSSGSLLVPRNNYNVVSSIIPRGLSHVAYREETKHTRGASTCSISLVS